MMRRNNRRNLIGALLLWSCCSSSCWDVAQGFAPTAFRPTAVTTTFRALPLSMTRKEPSETESSTTSRQQQSLSSRLQDIWQRTDTLESSGLNDLYQEHPPLVSRGGGLKRWAAFFVVGFLIKWYRARFINKIPVWDRQPMWNTVVTTKEQEEQLKAYTCKKCGSTLFIARNREWFFEGRWGLEQGCYTCGAKGEENFIMDRDRIVEDVGDDDDYFDYERPLDFVSAAQRRSLLRETKGDEEAANQMLLDMSAEAAGDDNGQESSDGGSDDESGSSEGEEVVVKDNVDSGEEQVGDIVDSAEEKVEAINGEAAMEEAMEETVEETVEEDVKEESPVAESEVQSTPEPEPEPEPTTVSIPEPDVDDVSLDDLDELGI